MKTNKSKIVAAALAAVLTLSLAGCGGTVESTGGDNANTTAAAAETEKSAEEPAAETTEAPAAPADSAEETTAASDAAPAELPPEDPPVDYVYTAPKLEEVGKFKDEHYTFYDDTSIYAGDSEESIEALDYLGNKLAGGGIPFVDKLKNAPVYCFRRKDGDIVYSGLMTAEGNIMLDTDQKVGMFSAIDSDNSRFIKAYFPEGVTDSKDEAIYYVTANQYSFQPTDTDTLYKGTVKVYDLHDGKFLENTACHYDPMYTINGDVISFKNDAGERVSVRADDTMFELKDYKRLAGDKFVIDEASGKTEVFDHDMNKLFETDKQINDMMNSSYYYTLRDSEAKKYGVISAMGRTVVEPKYCLINGVADNYFSYSNSEEFKPVGLLSADGTELTPENYKLISEIMPGYFSAADMDDKHSVLDKTGKVLFTETDDKTLNYYDSVPYYKDGDDNVYLILSTGEFSLRVPYGGIKCFYNTFVFDYKNSILYEAVTGEKLFEGFDKAYAAFGCIYILKNGEYTVYKVVTE